MSAPARAAPPASRPKSPWSDHPRPRDPRRPLPPLHTHPGRHLDRGLPECGQPRAGAGRLPWPPVQTLLENSLHLCEHFYVSWRAGSSSPGGCGRNYHQTPPPKGPLPIKGKKSAYSPPDCDPVVFSGQSEESNCPSSKLLSSEGEEVLSLQITRHHDPYGA